MTLKEKEKKTPEQNDWRFFFFFLHFIIVFLIFFCFCLFFEA